jgi:hypothetical protein
MPETTSTVSNCIPFEIALPVRSSHQNHSLAGSPASLFERLIGMTALPDRTRTTARHLFNVASNLFGP